MNESSAVTGERQTDRQTERETERERQRDTETENKREVERDRGREGVRERKRGEFGIPPSYLTAMAKQLGSFRK